MTTELTIYSNAKRAIAEYKTVDEVKDFRDKAVAVEAYAKQANDRELEWDAARARVRAERRCGELLLELEKAKGGQPYQSNGTTSSEPPKTLSEMGLTKDQSSKFQQLARVPEDEFESSMNNPAAKPSTKRILKKPQPQPPRMDGDALWLWGTLRDMRARGLFDRDLNELLNAWTDAMSADADGLVNQLKKWMNAHG